MNGLSHTSFIIPLLGAPYTGPHTDLSHTAVADPGFTKGDTNLLFGIILDENYMKMKTIGLRGPTDAPPPP